MKNIKQPKLKLKLEPIRIIGLDEMRDANGGAGLPPPPSVRKVCLP